MTPTTWTAWLTALPLLTLALTALVVAAALVPPARAILRRRARGEKERAKAEIAYLRAMTAQAEAGALGPEKFDRMLTGMESTVRLAGIGAEVARKRLAADPTKLTTRGEREEAAAREVVAALPPLAPIGEDPLAELKGGATNGVARAASNVSYLDGTSASTS